MASKKKPEPSFKLSNRPKIRRKPADREPTHETADAGAKSQKRPTMSMPDDLMEVIEKATVDRINDCQDHEKPGVLIITDTLAQSQAMYERMRWSFDCKLLDPHLSAVDRRNQLQYFSEGATEVLIASLETVTGYDCLFENTKLLMTVEREGDVWNDQTFSLVVDQLSWSDETPLAERLAVVHRYPVSAEDAKPFIVTSHGDHVHMVVDWSPQYETADGKDGAWQARWGKSLAHAPHPEVAALLLLCYRFQHMRPKPPSLVASADIVMTAIFGDGWDDPWDETQTPELGAIRQRITRRGRRPKPGESAQVDLLRLILRGIEKGNVTDAVLLDTRPSALRDPELDQELLSDRIKRTLGDAVVPPVE